MNRINGLDWLSFVLLIVGGLNWGLVGIFEYNLVLELFGEGDISRGVFALVGLAAVYTVYTLTKIGSAQATSVTSTAAGQIRKAS